MNTVKLDIKQIIVIIVWFICGALFLFSAQIYHLIIPIAVGICLMPSTLLIHLSVLLLLGVPKDIFFFIFTDLSVKPD